LGSAAWLELFASPFLSPGLRCAVAFAFGERRRGEVVSFQVNRLSDRPHVAPEPRAQVTDLTMARIQIDREAGRVLLLVAAVKAFVDR
jgi:hypothetical protein